MSSNSSASLNTITDNLEVMITSVIYIGADFKPVPVHMKVPGLQAKLSEGKDALAQVSTAESAVTLEVSERGMLFGTLQGRATQFANTFYATCPESPMRKAVEAGMRKLRGQRASAPPTNPDGTPGESHSVSEGSYGMLVKQLTDLINDVAKEVNYTVTEGNMSLVAMREFRDSLGAANSAVNNAKEALKQARIHRDEVLFGKLFGIVAVAQQVKAYVKGTFGATSPQFKLISGLRFEGRKGRGAKAAIGWPVVASSEKRGLPRFSCFQGQDGCMGSETMRQAGTKGVQE